MSLQTDIKSQIADAMRSKDAVRLSVLRSIVSSFTNELVAKGKKPQEELADTDALAVIKRLVKQRKDSIEQFQKGGREDLASDEKAELEVLEKFVPASMSKDAILKIAEAKKAEMNITDKSKMGMLMGAIIKEAKGEADGADVKEIVESLFK